MTEPDPMEVEQYKGLWTADRNDYLLVRDEDRPEPRIINIGRKYPEAKVFTDDGLATAVKRRMREAGVPVVTWDEMRRAHQRRQGGQ
jgi:hypothetical protein